MKERKLIFSMFCFTIGRLIFFHYNNWYILLIYDFSNDEKDEKD